MNLRLRLDTSGLKAVQDPRARARAVDKWRRRAGPYLHGVTVRQIRSRTKGAGRTGFLSGSARFVLTPAGVEVEVAAGYASFFDQPTRPHEIRPVRAKALAFPGAGARRGERGGRGVSVFRFGGKQVVRDLVYAQVVHHPGTKGAFFVRATVEEAEPVLQRMLDEEVARELGGQA